MGVKSMYFGAPWLCEKGGVQMTRGGLWVCSSAWCEKGIMRRFCKNASRVFGEFKERACVHSFGSAEPLGINCLCVLGGRGRAWDIITNKRG